MDIPLLEQLARQMAQGRRDAAQLVDAVGGRYRERAVLQETVRFGPGTTTAANRLLLGDPALALAALLSECRAGVARAPGAVLVDLHPARGGNPDPLRYAQWIPCLFLLQALAPDAPAHVLAPRDGHAVLRLVLDAAWPKATIVDDVAHAAAATVTASGNVAAADHGRAMLLLAQDPARCLSHLQACDRWIAFGPDAAFAAHLRRACILQGMPVDLATVGAAPGEWTRRHAAGKPLDAMQAALRAFGATPLASSAPATPASRRRRAGMDVLLGECIRDGLRTLVWVDAPDRRTTDASLCRAITRRDVDAEAWDRVVVLGWHFAPTIAQHLALRSDARLDAFAVSALSRPARRGEPLSVDPHGFRRVAGLTGAWIDRARAHRAPGVEFLTITLQPQALDARHAIVDWAVDPDHADEVFRGAWHASREGASGLHSARLRLPWRAAPRRVCIRAVHGDGSMSDVVLVVRHKPDRHDDAATRVQSPLARYAVAEALC